MARFVQKFGGSSVATPERIAHVAERVAHQRQQGDQIALVISAMAGTTNDLVNLAHQFSGEEGHPEYDVVVSAGEQVSAGLIALALAQHGVPAQSWLAWQLPLRTTAHFSCADILAEPLPALEQALQKGKVPVISGFQGVTSSGRLTTLGRGGSDLTAVAIAAAINAPCETYKDVEGIYTADPNIVAEARCLSSVNYEDMLAFAIYGSKVLQARAVVYARKHQVPIHVRSSFTSRSGTRVMVLPQERPALCGIACASPLVAIEIMCSPAAWPSCLTALKQTDFPFTLLPRTEQKALLLLNRIDLLEAQRFCEISSILTAWTVYPLSPPLARLTVIGKEAAAQQETLRKQLQKEGLSLQEAELSFPHPSFLVPAREANRGLRCLHRACRLETIPKHY
ncbi:MAG: aspartate kinase [Holosporales bacterium]|nr:aspartate kinase [Holosporales bacterium]